MVNPVFTPIHPHFFQPLLPGFQRDLTVPVTFYLRYIKGREDQLKMVNLSLEGNETTWEVKMEGRRFTGGWEEFAVAHGFKVGDLLVFRHEGGLVFHVTAFGPSGCQIQCAPFHPHDFNEDANHRDDDIKNLSRKKKAKKSLKSETDPSNHTCFRAVVTAAGLRKDTLYIPTEFARQNGLNNRNCWILLMNRRGRRSWKLTLRHAKCSGRVYIRRGWRDFCDANGQRVGDSFSLKLVQNGSTPVLQMFPAESGSDNNVNSSGEYLKTEENKTVSAKPGCNSKKSPGECSKMKKQKTRSIQGVSSLPEQNRFLTLTLKPSSSHNYVLRLPKNFARLNGLDKHGQKITLQGKDGREWSTCLRLEKRYDRVCVGKGWREFCLANEIKIGESFTLELIWQGTVPTLKLCSKV